MMTQSTFSPLLIGAFFALPYIVYTTIQTIRGRRQTNRFGTLLGYVGLVVPLAAMVANVLSGAPSIIVNAAIIGNAIIVFLISIVIAALDMRHIPRDLSHSFGVLGVGIAIMLIAANAVVLTLVPNASALAVAMNPASGQALGAATSPTPGAQGFISGMLNAVLPAQGEDQAANMSSAAGSTTVSIMPALIEETGLSASEIRGQLANNPSIGQLVSANGGDIAVVEAAVLANLQQQLDSGAIPEPMASMIRGNVGQAASMVVSGQVPAQAAGQLLSSLLGPAEADTAIAQVVTSTPTLAPTIMPTPTTSTPLPTETPTPSRTPFRYSSPTPEPTLAGPTCEVVVQSNLNLRAEPSVDGQLYLTIPYSTHLIASGQSEDGTWLFVEYGEQQGWVNGEYVNYVRECEPLLIR